MYKFDSRVRYSETGPDRRLTLNSLIDYFQDCATFHSEDIGVGFGYLEENDMMWVLVSWQIVINEMPEVCENIKVATWPYAFKSFYGERNLALYSEDDRLLAYANSLWIIVNLKTGHPMKPTQAQKDAYVVEPKLDMEYAPRKIKVPEKGEALTPAKVHKFQIDSNGHVNNGQYVLIARECLPADFKIRQVRAEYKNAAVLDDMIIPVVHRSEDTYIVVLKGENDQIFSIVEFKK